MFDTGALEGRSVFIRFSFVFRSFSVAFEPCVRSFFIRQDYASRLFVRFSFDGKIPPNFTHCNIVVTTNGRCALAGYGTGLLVP